jgi:PTS system mannitol-specific IIC component
MKTSLHRLGGFLAGMMVPNIGAFMAWGLITALFIPTGWLPNPRLARLVDPMILVLLPVLIGLTGGRLVHGLRGGVVGAVATMGVVAGSAVPMFLGAMVMGPLGGLAVRAFDRMAARRVPLGFEMLVANFSAGIIGMALALAGLLAVEPAVSAATAAMALAARRITEAGLLPLLALLIEPGKVFFLNNAINHSLLAPLGVAQAKEAGKSVFFLLETNPGPGLGLLLAYALAGRGAARASSPGAMIIHFLGGIHEVYFPYVLMKPATLAAVVLGGLAADMAFVAAGAGLLATPRPAASSPRWPSRRVVACCRCCLASRWARPCRA